MAVFSNLFAYLKLFDFFKISPAPKLSKTAYL